MARKVVEQYSKEEAAKRLVAARRGARLAGHVPMKANKAAKKIKAKKNHKKIGMRTTSQVFRRVVFLPLRAD